MADPKKKRKLYIQASSVLTKEKADLLDKREKLRKLDPKSADMLDDMDRRLADMTASTNILERATDKTEKSTARLEALAATRKKKAKQVR